MSSPFTTDDLTTPLTVADVKASIYRVMATIGVSTTGWKPGAVVRTIVAANAIVIAALSNLIALIARSGFLELAAGAWLTLVAFFTYNVTRIEATFASGNVTLNNTGGGVYSLGPGDLILSNPATGKTYRNTSPVSVGALQVGIVVPVAAIEAGAASTALPNEITGFVTPLLGVNSTNPLAVVGFDAEEDPALQARCSDKLGSLSPNGPPDAYSFVARSALRADGSPVGVTRVRSIPDGLGGIDVYLATPSGGLTGTVGDLSTDLGAADDLLQRSATPLAVTARVHAASPVVIPVTYEIWLYNDGGLTSLQIQDAIGVELANFMAVQPIGGNAIDVDPGKVFVSAISAVVGRARLRPTDPASPRLAIFRVAITDPATDTVIAAGQVPVLGAVSSIGIHLLPGVA
jgi:hypothetical protein